MNWGSYCKKYLGSVDMMMSMDSLMLMLILKLILIQ